MAKFLRLGKVAAAISAAGLCLPLDAPVASAEEPHRIGSSAVMPESIDIALAAHGTLEGIVRNADGGSAGDARVFLRGADRKVHETTTDETGRFSFESARPGAYEIVAVNAKGQSRRLLRVWPSQAAPPKAKREAELVLAGSETVVRGQGGAGTGTALAVVGITAAIATAIAVPVAMANNNRDRALASP